MHFFSPILVGGLLATGLASYAPSIAYSAESLQLSNSGQQHLLASNDTCASSGRKSPPPGCGRRE